MNFTNSSEGGPPAAPAGRSAQEFLLELKRRVAQRRPEALGAGPEHPGWVLMEALAEALADLDAEMGLQEERAYLRFFESLGEESLWVRPADGAVVFAAAEGLEESVLVPRGTIIGASREPGKLSLTFETTSSAWISSSRLLRMVSTAGGRQTEIFPYPQSGWDGETVSLFGDRLQVLRHLYLGDPLLEVLREQAAALVLEWPGLPEVCLEGTWEISAHGGWRSLAVEFEESRSAKGKRVLRMRIPGPAPDLKEERIEGALLPWLRLSLPGDRRIVLPQPAWVGCETPGGDAPRKADLARVAGGGAVPAFPRPVMRLLSLGGERWEDHSLSGQRILPAQGLEAWDPAVYLGWERSGAGSVYWSLANRPVPEGWAGELGRESPRWPRLVWEYSCGRGFKPLEVEDGTFDMTRSGTVSWKLPEEWTPQEHFGERLHWARARWVAGSYRCAPRVRAILPHSAAVRQVKTAAQHSMEVVIDRTGRCILPLSFAEGEPGPFEALEIKRAGGDWEKLSREGGCDRVAREPGTPPETSPAGRPEERFRLRRICGGSFRIDVAPRMSGPVTMRFPCLDISAGARGNLPPGSLRRIEGEIPGIERVLQPLPTAGGADGESPEDFRRRLLAAWGTGNRAVTSLDLRALCMSLDPEIGRVEAERDEADPARVLVTVVPIEPCRPGRFSPARLGWLSETLERKAPLGTVVQVSEALYVPVEIHARQVEETVFPSEASRRVLEGRLRCFLDPLRGGPQGLGFPPGRWLKEEDLATIICSVLKEGPAGSVEPAARAARDAGGDASGEPPRKPSESSPVWRIRGLRDVNLLDWDPRSWRFCLTGPSGAPLAQGLEDPAALDGFPRVFPVLERLVFEPLEGYPGR